MKKNNIIYISLLLAFLWAGKAFYHYVFDYQLKSEEDIALVLGIDSVDIISFDYVENSNFKDYDVIELYKLSDNTISNFINKSSLILYDKFYELNKSCHKINWNKTPVDLSNWNDLYITVIESQRSQNEYNDWRLKIQDIVSSSDNFYSLYYTEERNFIGLFVLNINERELYCLHYKD